MRINIKEIRAGMVKLQIETPEDLWHLQKVLESGDMITAKTHRKTLIKRGAEIEEGRRETITLTISLEKTEYHRDFHNLRLLGKIVSAPEDIQINSYHTISVGIGSFVKIQKEQWKKWQIERLKKAKARQFSALLCLIDREEADFGLLTSAGLEMLAIIYPKRVRKGFEEEKREEFYKKAMEYLMQSTADIIILAGPGFERENLFQYIKEKNKLLAEKIRLEHASETGANGMQEVIKKSGNRILRESRVAEETGWVEKLLEGVAKDGLVVFGKEDTEKAVNMGAVETLLVSEEKMQEFEGLMDIAEKMKGKVIIISSEHESGEKFLNIGGVAGFLRFRVS